MSNKLDLKVVDEAYQPEPGDKQAVYKQIAASAIREGRRREKAEQAADRARLEGEHAGQLAGARQAHEQELARHGKLVGKAAHREGFLVGTLCGMIAIAVAIGGTWMVVKDAVILNTATQRVNYPQPPTLTDQYLEQPSYERGAREPGNAGN